jgi:hypothetical protein
VDEEEFDSLRRWGEALIDDPRDEVRAAGKAIMLLAAEVERLQVELWHLRLGVGGPDADGKGPPVAASGDPAPELDASLRAQARSILGRVTGAAKRLQPDRLFHRD